LVGKEHQFLEKQYQLNEVQIQIKNLDNCSKVELRSKCKELSLPVSGTRGALIARISSRLQQEKTQPEEKANEAKPDSSTHISVKDLKAKCREYGLPVSGTKSELQLRLEEHSKIQKKTKKDLIQDLNALDGVHINENTRLPKQDLVTLHKKLIEEIEKLTKKQLREKLQKEGCKQVPRETQVALLKTYRHFCVDKMAEHKTPKPKASAKKKALPSTKVKLPKPKAASKKKTQVAKT